MNKLTNDTVLRLAAEAEKYVDATYCHVSEMQITGLTLADERQDRIYAKFAALIQTEREKVDTEVADAHDLLDRHQIPRQTSFGIPLSLMGRIALAITGDANPTAKAVKLLLKEARKIMMAHPTFRNSHKDFLQRSADALK